ncbi:MAG: PQQ-dependent sugar dehydrogenase, partial [Rhizobacter sp.]
MTRPPENKSADLQRRASLLRLSALCAAVALPQISCGGGGGSDTPPTSGPPAPPPGGGGSGGGSSPPPPPPSGPPPSGPPRLTQLNTTSAGALTSPWGFVFLPDGRMLVTQKDGAMVVMSADGRTRSAPLSGVPTVNNSGQGGLLDVVLDPDFTATGSNWVYFTYSENGTGGVGTAVNRGRLDLANNQLLDVNMTPLFRQFPKTGEAAHFGSRLAFRADK